MALEPLHLACHCLGFTLCRQQAEVLFLPQLIFNGDLEDGHFLLTLLQPLLQFTVHVVLMWVWPLGASGGICACLALMVDAGVRSHIKSIFNYWSPGSELLGPRDICIKDRPCLPLP